MHWEQSLQGPARKSCLWRLLPRWAAPQAVQESENDKAEIVIVCEPEGMSLQMGGLHPRASLYEKPVNLEAAKQVGAAAPARPIVAAAEAAWRTSRRELAPKPGSAAATVAISWAASQRACRFFECPQWRAMRMRSALCLFAVSQHDRPAPPAWTLCRTPAAWARESPAPTHPPLLHRRMPSSGG